MISLYAPASKPAPAAASATDKGSDSKTDADVKTETKETESQAAASKSSDSRPLDVTVSIKPQGAFTCEYPSTSSPGVHRVAVGADGTLTRSEADGKTSVWHQLFYDAVLDSKKLTESKQSLQIDRSLAHCISSEGATAFLEGVADAHRLNPKEAADFITLFLPRMEMADFTLVQINPPALLEQLVVAIEPKPDAFIRCFIMTQAVPEAVTCGAPALPSVAERKGFVCTEWGGMNLDERRLHIA